ncbi:MAG: ribosomal protein L7Ae-like RNA K-turn-binding protein [Akkermansiaceae bacterium]|jgi:ribosomal protein L7Ae-like RNA K-turn-binding protein/protein required for attachment to host cells
MTTKQTNLPTSSITTSKKRLTSQDLRKALNRLSDIAPSDSPLISCFINLTENLQATLQLFDRQAKDMARHFVGSRLVDFQDAYGEIRKYLTDSVPKGSRGAAIYARWGKRPLLIPLDFKVVLETKLVVDTLPHIYPVIETRDTYHRFAIVIVTEKEARIVETVMGAVTQEIFTERPELRERLGREWTRERFQKYRDEQNDRFMKQKIEILDELMQRRGHNHLVIAGSPKMVARLTKSLPTRLKDKLITTLFANPSNGIYPIVVEALEVFTAYEHIESHDRVSQLQSAILSAGLGVAGSEETQKAIAQGYADMLIINKELPDSELRERLVRLAIRNDVPIETVKDSDVLEELSGVGCLLSYRPHSNESVAKP